MRGISITLLLMFALRRSLPVNVLKTFKAYEMGNRECVGIQHLGRDRSSIRICAGARVGLEPGHKPLGLNRT
jgi:hypothetical protein